MKQTLWCGEGNKKVHEYLLDQNGPVLESDINWCGLSNGLHRRNYARWMQNILIQFSLF